MNKIENPFEYGEATNLSPEQIISYYIQDFNYSRFIQSTRNIFLIGERGAGKTMTLLYNNEVLQKEFNHQKEEKNLIGIYIPCKTLLFYKQEYELFQNDQYVSALISENFLVLSLAYAIADTLDKLSYPLQKNLEQELIKDFSYVIGKPLPSNKSLISGLKLFLDKESFEAQKLMNNPDPDAVIENAYSFFSLIIPMINFLKRIPTLKNVHFLFLIDDIHDLNKYQVRSLNSWIGYRDHSNFSFKVSASKLKRPELITATGGTILEGHDFLTIDMEEPFQNKFSDFGHLAKKIVNNRLSLAGIKAEADDFFPLNKSFSSDLEKSEKIVRMEAEEIYASNEKKKISDYVYKYKRAHYFRSRSSRANLPPYSGFETIVHLSTGVIRNLLYPCYWMYDKAISLNESENISFIKPSIQTEIIKEKSEELWKKIEMDLFNSVQDCSTKQAVQIKNLFENLAILFRERLNSKISEPRAITFTISGYSSELKENIEPLLRISQEAQILYTRVGSAKEDGKREIYYVPNRLLFPIYGLDPVGQHARVSLKAEDVWAATKGKKFQLFADTEDELKQSKLFDNEN